MSGERCDVVQEVKFRLLKDFNLHQGGFILMFIN